MRIPLSLSILACTLAFSLGATPRGQTPGRPSLTGAWRLNNDLSDRAPERGDEAERGRRGRGAGGVRGGGGRGGMGRGGMGRGGARGDDREAMARVRDAMRDIVEAPERLTITETESMVVVTSGDGRTTRLSTDGSKVKDDNTKIERRTKWDGNKLVSEISGAGRGKIVQTYSVDPESRQLRITLQMDGPRGGQPRTVAHAYDRDEPR